MFFLSASSHLRGEKEATGDQYSRESNKRGQGILTDVHVSGGDHTQAHKGICECEQGVRLGITAWSQDGRVTLASVLFAEILEAEP